MDLKSQHSKRILRMDKGQFLYMIYIRIEILCLISMSALILCPIRNLEMITSSWRFSIYTCNVAWFIDFTLNRIKFICVMEIPINLPKRVYIYFH
jgi:hypothetical protein